MRLKLFETLSDCLAPVRGMLQAGLHFPEPIIPSATVGSNFVTVQLTGIY